jgi:hypothetical protein
MSDFDEFLRRVVVGFDPTAEEGLEATRRRVERRQRRRRFAAGGVTVGMFGAILAGAVWLGGPPGRPTVGPTPSLSLSPRAGEPTTCSPGFRNTGEVCITRTSDVVQVASGVTGGQPWSVQGFTVVYQGPDPRVGLEARKGTHSELAMLCMRIEAGGPDASFCQRALGGGIWGIEGIDDLVADPTLAPVRGLDAAAQNPLQGLEDGTGGFLSLPLRDGHSHLSVTWTPEATARAEVTVDDGAPIETPLEGPFPELATKVKWIVAAVPGGAKTLTSTAYDAQGTVLWEEVDHAGSYPPASPPPIPDEPPLTVAELTHAGTVWRLRAYSVAPPEGNRVLCLSFARVGEDASTVCTWAGGFAHPYGGMYSVDVDGNGPLPAALFGAASSQTTHATVSQGDSSRGAEIYPAPPALGLDVVFVVAFAEGAAPATTRGYDSRGNLLWTDVKTFPSG